MKKLVIIITQEKTGSGTCTEMQTVGDEKLWSEVESKVLHDLLAKNNLYGK